MENSLVGQSGHEHVTDLPITGSHFICGEFTSERRHRHRGMRESRRNASVKKRRACCKSSANECNANYDNASSSVSFIRT
jgi:hypothetical protein